MPISSVIEQQPPSHFTAHDDSTLPRRYANHVEENPNSAACDELNVQTVNVQFSIPLSRQAPRWRLRESKRFAAFFMLAFTTATLLAAIALPRAASF
jgi:hypothetical protein